MRLNKKSKGTTKLKKYFMGGMPGGAPPQGGPPMGGPPMGGPPMGGPPPPGMGGGAPGAGGMPPDLLGAQVKEVRLKVTQLQKKEQLI